MFKYESANRGLLRDCKTDGSFAALYTTLTDMTLAGSGVLRILLGLTSALRRVCTGQDEMEGSWCRNGTCIPSA